MAVNTYMLDFTVGEAAVGTSETRHVIMDSIEKALKDHLTGLRRSSVIEIDQGFMLVLVGSTGIVVSVRGYKEGIVTINIEHYKHEMEDPILPLEQIRVVEMAIAKALRASRSKHLPPIKRGGLVDIYLTTSGGCSFPETLIMHLVKCTSCLDCSYIEGSKCLGSDSSDIG